MAGKTDRILPCVGDESTWHYGAFIHGELVCVASVYLTNEKARLRKFATDSDYQGQGIGSKMLTFILNSLKNTQTKTYWCDARTSAVGFYEQFGMGAYGQEFYKVDVPYLKLKVTL